MSSLFFFVQFEFTHSIGPGAGRYVVANPASVDEYGAAPRTDDIARRERLTGVTMKPSTADVLAISVLTAGAPRQTLRRRARPADASAPTPDVPLLLVTFIRGTQPLQDSREAERALEELARDEAAQDAWVADGLHVTNRAIRAYRAASRDPYITEVARRDARAVRIGYGSTGEVADGQFQRAITLAPPAGQKATREERLVPAEATADLLAGRGRVLEAEELLVRAYADLDHARLRAAAHQAASAVALLPVELRELDAESAVDFADLAAAAQALIDRAVQDEADSTLADELEELIGKVERIIEQWRYAALDL